ncbi:MAG: carbohydrate kinase family protein [Armatimonadota bacterium]|nr:carbohydrate kinase family protein [Armatimonadota bacterium]MDR7536628.1 carbohydrate kinase family protein [Armatimonadota bacterium]
MRLDLITAGGCTVDIVYAADGTTAGRQLGGNAIYAAAGAHIWGLRAGVVAFCGTGLPARWADVLAALEIDTEGLVPVNVPASVTEFFYGADGERTQRLWAPDTRGAPQPYLPADTGEPIRQLRLSPAHLPPRYLRARAAHLAPLPPEVQRALVGALAHMDPLTLDPSPHLMGDASPDALRALLEPVAVFLPSREEVRARYPQLSPHEALAQLAPLARRATVIKLGRHGALVGDGAGRRHVVPAVPVRARDPTGAGDAFCGGMLAGLLDGRDVVQAAACGAVSASFAVERFGLAGLILADPTERDRRWRWVLEHTQ